MSDQTYPQTEEPAFRRAVTRIDDSAVVAGNIPGHKARHLMDGREAAFTDPFLVLAEDWMPRGAFPRHPHRGMETMTYVIEGSLEHFDSAGSGGVLNAGDAQWMTAGRGVQHDGNPPAGTISHTLQLWINLPASAKMTEPRYQDLFGAAMPVRREPGVEARVFSGRSGDVVSPTLNHVPVTMVEARIEPGCAFDQPLAGGDNAFVYVLDGVAKIGAVAVPAGRLAWLTRPEQPRPSDVTIRTEDGAARVLIVAGPPLREPIAFGGPFVMNTQAEIRQAFEDFRAGRF